MSADERAHEEQPETSEAPPVATPAADRGIPSAPTRAAVDSMPFERSALARMSPDERSALYLNQIRKMMIFLTVVVAVGIVVGVIIGIVAINAVHQAQQSTGPVGF